MVNQEECLIELERAIKTRNLFKVRELLMDNLKNFPTDREFLEKCAELAHHDALIYHKHDQEYLNANDQKWNRSDYSYLKQRLRKNFSYERYQVAIKMADYFEILRVKEAEEAAKLEAELALEALRKTRAEKKKQKRLLKKQQREARKLKRRAERNLPRKQVLMGVKVSGLAIIYLIIYLILTEF